MENTVNTITSSDVLLKLLNDAWLLIPEKPKYNNFNSKVSFGKNISLLEKLESINPKLGLSDFLDYPFVDKSFGLVQGMSVLSIIATITDVLINKRLGAVIDDIDGSILSWTYV